MAEPNHREEESTPGGQTLVSDETEAVRPPLFRVILLNDDYTPMDFVIWILETIFHHSQPVAFKLMLDVHQKGQGLCGVYPFDVARTKVAQVEAHARENEHPLRCVMEKESGEK